MIFGNLFTQKNYRRSLNVIKELDVKILVMLIMMKNIVILLTIVNMFLWESDKEGKGGNEGNAVLKIN